MALLTGTRAGARRRAAPLAAARATAQSRSLVGTHALFQDGVAFRDLGLAVIDEQHRFGVGQRLDLLRRRAEAVDVLLMTATPIPRSLVLAAYGDLAVSQLRTKPPGRQPIATRPCPDERHRGGGRRRSSARSAAASGSTGSAR